MTHWKCFFVPYSPKSPGLLLIASLCLLISVRLTSRRTAGRAQLLWQCRAGENGGRLQTLRRTGELLVKHSKNRLKYHLSDDNCYMKNTFQNLIQYPSRTAQFFISYSASSNNYFNRYKRFILDMIAKDATKAFLLKKSKWLLLTLPKLYSLAAAGSQKTKMMAKPLGSSCLESRLLTLTTVSACAIFKFFFPSFFFKFWLIFSEHEILPGIRNIFTCFGCLLFSHWFVLLLFFICLFSKFPPVPWNPMWVFSLLFWHAGSGSFNFDIYWVC